MNKSLEQTKLKKIFSGIGASQAWDSILEDVNNDILQSGKPLDSIKLLNNIRMATVISAMLIVPASIFLAIQVSPIFVGINLVWIVLFAFPKIQQSNLGQERKKNIEQELSSFVIFASVMQNVGIGLYASFQMFRDIGLFKAASHEAMLLKRNVEYFGLSQMEALEEVGRAHPSEPFRNLMLGYTSIWRSGGDLSLYLENRADEFFSTLKQQYQNYSNNIGTVIEILVTLLIILPIMIMVASFVMPGSSLEQITLLAVIGLPVFAVVLGIITSSIQPRTFNDVGLGQKTIAVLALTGLALGGILFFFYEQLWIAISAAVIAPSAISAVISGRHYYEVNQLEKALTQFLRDMTEYKKIGYDVLLAIGKLSDQNLYNPTFNKKLAEIKALLDHGSTPTKSVNAVEFRSRFTHVSFYLLAYIAEYGGGNPRTLETINRFIGNAKQSIKEGRSSAAALSLIVFATPLIMGFTAAMILDIIDSFDSSMFENLDQNAGSEFGMGQNYMAMFTASPQFLEIIKTLIVTSSLLSAFIITKGIDFTFYNAWRVVVIGVIAIATVIGIENFQSISFDSLFEGISFS